MMQLSVGSNGLLVNQQQVPILPTTSLTSSTGSNHSFISPDRLARTTDSESLDFPEIAGKYKVVSKIGEGTFSKVYLAKPISGDTNQLFALKRINPSCCPARIANEIQRLLTVNGKPHITSLLGGLRLRDQITLVFPYMPYDKFKDILLDMNALEIQRYIRALLSALATLHDHGIVHRDVKPGNFLYNRERAQYMLIDFGLSQTQAEILEHASVAMPASANASAGTTPPLMLNTPLSAQIPHSNPSSPDLKRKRFDKPPPLSLKRLRPELTSSYERFELSSILRTGSMSPGASVTQQEASTHVANSGASAMNAANAPRGGTRGFRAPEVLLKYPYQTGAVDIWSAGVVLLCVLSQRYPFFQSPDDLSSLCELALLQGTKELQVTASMLGRRLLFSHNIDAPKQDLRTLCQRLSTHPTPIPDAMYDLLEHLLDLNPFTRYTAKYALQHPIFQF